MNRWLTLILSLSALSTALLSVVAQSTSVTGDWEITIKSPDGDFLATVTIEQEGEKLSGRATGPLGVRSVPVEGYD